MIGGELSAKVSVKFRFIDLHIFSALDALESLSPNGFPIWREEDDSVTFTVRERKLPSEAAMDSYLDRVSKSKKNPRPGVRPYIEEGGTPTKTYYDWVQSRILDSEDSSVGDAQPATAAQLSDAQLEALERFKKK